MTPEERAQGFVETLLDYPLDPTSTVDRRWVERSAGDMRTAVAEMIRMIIAEEREACAAYMELVCARDCGCDHVCRYAASIRARTP